MKVAYAVPKVEQFVRSLREGLLSTNDIDLKYRIEAELISRGDLSSLQSAVNLLLKGTPSEREKELFLDVIANDVKDPRAVPVLRPLARAAGLSARKASVEALWHIADPSAEDVLINAITDSDRDVRYFAVRGLAETTGQSIWGPAPAEFDQHEQKYLEHWSGWARSNHIPPPTSRVEPQQP